MAKLRPLLEKAPGLFRSVAAILGGAALVIQDVLPVIPADPRQLFTASGIFGLIGIVRAALRKVQ